MKGEPILIDCEGTGSPTHRGPHDAPGAGMCAMCGRWVPATRGGAALPHKRDDILARIERGDFR